MRLSPGCLITNINKPVKPESSPSSGSTSDVRSHRPYDAQPTVAQRLIGEQPTYAHIAKVLNELRREMEGTYAGFPLRDGFPKLFPHILRKKAITVRPLGGCPMGHSPPEGAVNT